MTEHLSRPDASTTKPDTGDRNSNPNGPRRALILRWVVLIVAIVLINILAAHGLADLVETRLSAGLSGSTWLGVSALAIHALLLAIPFVPGVEIGISLLVMQGPAVAPYVHAATVVGLSLAFFVGWAFATKLPTQFLHTMGLTRAGAFVESIKGLNRAERLEYLENAAPRWAGQWILRHRYILVALLINLPGNSLIGGGGGILLVAGLSRLFSAPAIVLTLIVATAPVPLAVWLLGPDFFQ